MKTVYLISICCVCHKVLGKVTTTQYKEDTLSHGLCSKCSVIENAKLTKILKEHLGKIK